MKVKSFNTSKVYIDTLATHFTLIQPAPCVVAATAPNIKSVNINGLLQGNNSPCG